MLRSATEVELLVTYETILDELVRRQVSRTRDAPVGQYAEWLAAKRLGGELAANSVKSYDLTCDEFGKVQVKARLVRDGSTAGQLQLSPFRSFDFDHALIMIFDPLYRVTSATILPVKVVMAAGRESIHVRARVVTATKALLARGVDITERFASAV